MNNNDMTVGELYSSWIEDRIKTNGNSGGRIYKHYFSTYLLKRFGDRKVNSIPSNEYAVFVDSLSNIKGTQGQVLSSASLRQIVRTFGMMFYYGKTKFGLNDPTKEAAVVHKDNGKDTVFTADEVERLKKAAKPYDIHHIGIMLCLFTGITRGEICNLQWKYVDLDDKVLMIRQYFDVSDTGGRKLNRDILLPDEIAEQMKLIKPMYREDDYLLMGSSKPMDVSVFRYHYINLLKKAGIEYRKFGTLRNTFAANCLDSGMSVMELNRLLGNPNVDVTIRRYVDRSIKTG